MYMHKDPISTKALFEFQLIFSLYEDIIRMEEKERERKMGHFMYSIFSQENLE